MAKKSIVAFYVDRKQMRTLQIHKYPDHRKASIILPFQFWAKYSGLDKGMTP